MNYLILTKLIPSQATATDIVMHSRENLMLGVAEIKSVYCIPTTKFPIENTNIEEVKVPEMILFIVI